MSERSTPQAKLTSPDLRYSTQLEKLGSGSFKTVYKAFDHERGIEVAWNSVRINQFSEKERERLSSEVDILKQLTHPNIIVMYDHWEEDNHLYFITELMTSGTLREYLVKVGTAIRPSALKHWCRQILHALRYLHDDLKIIHRDLKLDNIFINGNDGEVKIGDMGLSTVLRTTHAASVIGTPEFMAPELFMESYTESVDIYSFGMCLLEMVTLEYPYNECSNAAQVYRKVLSGTPPRALQNVKDHELRSLIELCLLSSEYRPSARTLLDLHFLDPEAEADLLKLSKCLKSLSDPPSPIYKAPTPRSKNRIVASPVISSYTSDSSFAISIFLADGDAPKTCETVFNLHTDTPESVSEEMAIEFELTDEDRGLISSKISELVSSVSMGRSSTSPTHDETPSDTGSMSRSWSRRTLHDDRSTVSDSPLSSNLHRFEEEFRQFHEKLENEGIGAVKKLLPEEQCTPDFHALLQRYKTEMEEIKERHLTEFKQQLKRTTIGSSIIL
ncbi:hypothetical protein GEMRC1_000627 [Eukaryota sp. GEM-RC1]